MTGHRANGALAALGWAGFGAVGFGGVFERLAVNKWTAISPAALIALRTFYARARCFG